MGRAFGELHHQAMRGAGVPACPVALTDGNTLVLRAVDDVWAAWMTRESAASLGAVCAGDLRDDDGAGSQHRRGHDFARPDARRVILLEGGVIGVDRPTAGDAVLGSGVRFVLSLFGPAIELRGDVDPVHAAGHATSYTCRQPRQPASRNEGVSPPCQGCGVSYV